MSDGMSDAAWEEYEEQMKKKQRNSIDDITPEEWDAMAKRARENGTQEAYDILHYKKEPLFTKEVSDGSTASYYELPKGAAELQDLISAKNMNAQIGEIFRECYRYGQASHSDELRGIKKIIFYAQAELKRLENK